MSEPCIYESDINMIKDHVEAGKGWRKVMVGIVFAIILQVMGFLYTWGETRQIIKHNSSTIERVLTKLDNMKL